MTLLNRLFEPGKLTFVMDGAFGSSGKAKAASFITKHGPATLLVTSNSANASHTVVDGDRKIVFKALPSGSLYHQKLDKVYIAAGASFNVADLLREIEETGIPRSKVMIHPRASVITPDDIGYELGVRDFEGGLALTTHAGTMAAGSTCSGSGAALARKVLRHKLACVAANVPDISDMIGEVEYDLMERLDSGYFGIFEIGQGFPLSLNHYRFAPHTTSRNVTISSALNDVMLPPKYAGPVLLNFRTFPIRINSKKYVALDGTHLTWAEVQSGNYEYKIIESPSGCWYPDQTEITWEEVETDAVISIPQEVKNTTLTKLPRRIATFSKINLEEAIRYNDTGKVFLSINFANHVCGELYGARTPVQVTNSRRMTDWVRENIPAHFQPSVMLVGTSEHTDDFAVFPADPVWSDSWATKCHSSSEG